MAGQSVYNFACLTTALIDYKFKFAICRRVLNFLYFEYGMWYAHIGSFINNQFFQVLERGALILL